MTSERSMSEIQQLAERSNKHPATIVMTAFNGVAQDSSSVGSESDYGSFHRYDSYSLHQIKGEALATFDSLEQFLAAYTQNFDMTDTQGNSVELLLRMEQLTAAMRFIGLHGAFDLMQVMVLALNKLIESPSNILAEDLSVAVMLLKRYMQFALNKQALIPHFLLDITNELQLQLNLTLLSEGDFLSFHINASALQTQSIDSQKIAPSESLVNNIAKYYQHALLNVLSDKPSASGFELLEKTALAASELSVGLADGDYWSAVATSVHELSACVPLSNSRKRILITAERHFKNFGAKPSAKVLMDVYAFALSRNTPKAKQLRHNVGLEGKITTDNHAKQLYQQMFGPSLNTIEAVVYSIQTELQTIKAILNKPFKVVTAGIQTEQEMVAFRLFDIAHIIEFVVNADSVPHELKLLAGQLTNLTDQLPAALLNEIMYMLVQAENCLLIVKRQHTTAGALLPINNTKISQIEVDTAYELLIAEARSSIAVCAASLQAFKQQINQTMHVESIPAILRSVKGAIDFLMNPNVGSLLLRLSNIFENKLVPAKHQERFSIIESAVNILSATDHFLLNLQMQLPTAGRVFKDCESQLAALEKHKHFSLEND